MVKHGVSTSQIEDLIDLRQTEQMEYAYKHRQTLVELAQRQGICLASHDDTTVEHVQEAVKDGVAIAEFPASVDLAAQSRAYGAAVLMGAPNLIRGGSHLGWMSVAEAVKSDVVDCLCSDYHYPSLFHAPFQMEKLGLVSFEQAWKMVSSHPASVGGIEDHKGNIAPNLDADFMLVSPSEQPFLNRISSVYVAGEEVVHYS